VRNLSFMQCNLSNVQIRQAEADALHWFYIGWTRLAHRARRVARFACRVSAGPRGRWDRCTFDSGSFSRPSFVSASFDHADFSRATVRNSDLSNMRIENCDIRGLKINGVDIERLLRDAGR